MKINELRSIVREVIAEEIANESINKKKIAIAEIKNIISENELSEVELEEIFGMFKKSSPEEKLAKLEDELNKEAPETYKSWVAVIEKLGWKESGKIQMMIDSIEKYAKGYGYPKDGKYYTKGNTLLFNTKEGGSTLGVKVF